MQRELEVACRLAREAGAKVLEIYRKKDLGVEWKTPSDPVTAADKLANDFLVDSIRREFPEDGILAEESPDNETRLSRRRVWLIDPIDGTAEFIKFNGEFAVMIGLAIDGKPVVGAVYQPTEDRLYYAGERLGAFITIDGRTERARVSSIKSPAEMCLAISRSHVSRRIDQICERLGVCRIARSGSVGLKVGLLVDRRCDVYIHAGNRTSQWDTCAPDIILREAGGVLTDLAGRPMVYNGRNTRNLNGIVASNGQAHDQIVEVARAVVKSHS